MKFEYKVMTQKDRWFGGKFDPMKLDQALNAYAGEGWKVVSCTTAAFPTLTGSRDEMIVILERQVS